MTMTLSGDGTIGGLAAGGLPDNTIATNDIADNAITAGKIASSAVTPAKLSQPFTSGTAVASTSGTSIDFTSIPSWVKRITVMLAGVSTNGSSMVQLRLGTSGGVVTSGYSGSVSGAGGNAISTLGYSNGFSVRDNWNSTLTVSGKFTVENLNGNVWVETHAVNDTAGNAGYGAGSLSLSGVLDRVRITTVNGTDTFDAGSINILYE